MQLISFSIVLLLFSLVSVALALAFSRDWGLLMRDVLKGVFPGVFLLYGACSMRA